MGTSLALQEWSGCILDYLPPEILETVIAHVQGILVRLNALTCQALAKQRLRVATDACFVQQTDSENIGISMQSDAHNRLAPPPVSA